MIDLKNPTFDPLASFAAMAQAEQAQRTAKDARKASQEALKKQIIAPLIPALTAVFDQGIKIIGDYGRATTPEWKEDHGAWSCSYRGVTGTNTLFSVKADLISEGGNQRDHPPIPAITVMGHHSSGFSDHRPKLGQFRDWHSAYQCCIEALTKQLHQETLDRLSSDQHAE